MKIVSPSSKTTLILNGAFQAAGFLSARSAMRNLMVGAVKAYDINGNIHNWDSWIGHDEHITDDTPALRSVDQCWPVPTIVVLPNYFGNTKQRQKRRRRTINLRQLYNIYDGECQYCLKKIPFASSTRDHVLPRSKGGSNADDNIVLSCHKCNNKKSDKFPYLNTIGSEVKPKVLKDAEFTALSEKVQRRDEWKYFL